MSSAAPIAPRRLPQAHGDGDGDQRIVIPGIPWKTYLLLNDAVDTPSVRMAYCEGELEIMTVGPKHERWKKMIARLLELYGLERDVPLYGYGSTTLREEMEARGLEPDECYCLGRSLVDRPDLAIEVVVTHGGLDKLRIYAGLGVPEVWRFADGAFSLHRLRPKGRMYEIVSESTAVPGIDLALLASFAVREDQHEAVLEYRDHLRAPKRPPRGRGRRAP